MKQAILVVTYQNIAHISEMADLLNAEEFKFFVHVDKKSPIPQDEIAHLKSRTNVMLVSRKYRVNWGGLNLTRAILFLVEEALKDPDIEYVHLLSGADFPIKSKGDIIKALEQVRGQEFLESFRLQGSTWDNDGMDRLQFYHFTDWFNVKTYWGNKAVKLTLAFQKAFGIKRTFEAAFPPLYGGSTWWTLSSACLNYVLSYLKNNPRFLKGFRHSLIADEIVFQTIIMNSPYKDKVANHNFRMISWESEDSTHPTVLSETDHSDIQRSDKLFARKFEHPHSRKLLSLLKERLSMVSDEVSA